MAIRSQGWRQHTALSRDQQYFISIKTFFSIKLFRLPLEQIWGEIGDITRSRMRHVTVMTHDTWHGTMVTRRWHLLVSWQCSDAIKAPDVSSNCTSPVTSKAQPSSTPCWLCSSARRFLTAGAGGLEGAGCWCTGWLMVHRPGTWELVLVTRRGLSQSGPVTGRALTEVQCESEHHLCHEDTHIMVTRGWPGQDVGPEVPGHGHGAQEAQASHGARGPLQRGGGRRGLHADQPGARHPGDGGKEARVHILPNNLSSSPHIVHFRAKSHTSSDLFNL